NGSKPQNAVTVIILQRHARALVKHAVPGGDINIASVCRAVDGGSATTGPDAAIRAAHSVRGGVEDAHLLLHIGSVVAEQPSVIRRGILVRGKGHINNAVRERQARSVMLQLRSEAHHTAGRSITGTRHGSCNRHWRVGLLVPRRYVQSV